MYFYIFFEIINISIYSLLGLNSKLFLNFKACLIYYLVGFVSSILFLLGLYLEQYNIISSQNNLILNIDNSYSFGLWFIWFSLLIKLGSFPFSA